MKEKIDTKYREYLTEALGKTRLAATSINTMTLMRTRETEELREMRAAVHAAAEAIEKALAFVEG